MKISAKGRYGLAAMTYLARNYASGAPITIISISEKLGISKIYLEQVFSLLKRANLVNSIKGFLAEAGINVTINIQDNTAFFDDWDNINYNMLVSGLTLGADFNDWSYAFTTGGWLNQFGYQNEALDKKFQDAVSTPDTNERLALYSEINAELQENMPIVPIYFKTKYYAYTKGLKFPYSVTRFEFFDAAWE